MASVKPKLIGLLHLILLSTTYDYAAERIRIRYLGIRFVFFALISRDLIPHMITDAIAAMKERNGSSQVAIRKFVEEKYGKRLPLNFRKNLILHLKRLVTSGKLVKLKKSFKVPRGARSLPKSSTRSKSSKRKDKKAKAGAVRKWEKKNKKEERMEIKTVV